MTTTQPTIAFELITTAVSGGTARLCEERDKIRSLFEKHGLSQRVNTLLLPKMIPEEDDRPIALEEKIDPLDAKPTLTDGLPYDFIVTQVTAFTPEEQLRQRLTQLKDGGVSRVVFVGVPRVFDPKDICGPFPNQALSMFQDIVPSRGVVLIPTRPDEDTRFADKVQAGATFGLSQLLFTDQIVGFLRKLSERPERPEILLSLGYVPKLETERQLIHWLIRDTTPGAQLDMAAVARLAPLSLAEKRRELRALLRRIAEPAAELGFPLGLHYECPYGPSDPAIDCFNAVLDEWESIMGPTRMAHTA